MLHLFKDANYVRYYLAVVVSQLGDGITRTVIVYLVAKLTANPMMISFALFAQLAPTAILAVFTGALADRFSRKMLMVLSDFYRLIVVLMMIPARNNPEALLVLTILLGIGTAVFEPARVSSVPTIVGRNRIPEAVGLFQGTMSTIQFVAPSIAGLLLALNHLPIVFIIDGFTYLCSALLLSSLFIPKTEERIKLGEERPRYVQFVIEGVKEVFSSPALKSLLLFLMPIMLVNGILLTSYKAFLVETLSLSAAVFGLVEGAFGVGAIIGAIIGPRLLATYKAGKVILMASGGLGISMMLAFLLSDQITILFVYSWCLVTGCCYAFVQFPLASLFLQLAPAHLIGRGISIFQASTTIWVVIGLLLGGGLSSYMGPVLTLAFSGCFLFGISALLLVLRTDGSLNVEDGPG